MSALNDENATPLDKLVSPSIRFRELADAIERCRTEEEAEEVELWRGLIAREFGGPFLSGLAGLTFRERDALSKRERLRDFVRRQVRHVLPRLAPEQIQRFTETAKTARCDELFADVHGGEPIQWSDMWTGTQLMARMEYLAHFLRGAAAAFEAPRSQEPRVAPDYSWLETAYGDRYLFQTRRQKELIGALHRAWLIGDDGAPITEEAILKDLDETVDRVRISERFKDHLALGTILQRMPAKAATWTLYLRERPQKGQ